MSDYMELTLHSVADRGQPNSERIVLRANAAAALNEYGLSLGLQTKGGVRPYRDNVFWFPENSNIDEGDWIFIYTGPGERNVTALSAPFTGRLHSFHWDRSQTVFFHPSVVPIVFRIFVVAALPAPPFMLPAAQELKSITDVQEKTKQPGA
jgi:hypothetical protein